MEACTCFSSAEKDLASLWEEEGRKGGREGGREGGTKHDYRAEMGGREGGKEGGREERMVNVPREEVIFVPGVSMKKVVARHLFNDNNNNNR